MNKVILEQIEPLRDALKNTDLLVTIEQKIQGKKSTIGFPYMKCDTSALMAHICLGYQLVMGIYVHTQPGFDLYRTRLIEHMDPEKRKELKPAVMSATFLGQYLRTYHYFNLHPTEKEYVDISYGQYEPATPIYVGVEIPPGVSDVRQVLLTEGDRINPDSREIIKKICLERGLIK